MRAVADIGFYDRSVLRDTFLVTLAKSQEEKRLLSDCFDVFFDHPELSQPLADDDSSASSNPEEASESGQAESATGAPSAGLGQLAQTLLSQDRAEMEAAIANAANAASLSDIRFFTQRGVFSSRILDLLGIQQLRDDLEQLAQTNPSEAERLAAATEALRENVRDRVSQALLLYGREETENLRNEILKNAPLSQLDRRQADQMRTLIRTMARRLRERYSRPR